MISRIYQLVDTKRIEMKEREIIPAPDTVLVRPEYLAICSADQRYYLGQRRKEILDQKLPMALIHEATGTVVHDFRGILPSGTKVVLIPLAEDCGGMSWVKPNYRENNQFASSGTDGFMRDLIAIQGNRLLPAAEDYSSIYVFAEILSVALGAIRTFEATRQTPVDSFGVWGDGSVGFVTALALHCKYPGSRLCVFGKSARKLSKFSFASQKYYIDSVPDGMAVSHAFECVGGRKSEDAIRQILTHIQPQGTVNLMGVSENSVAINTRTVLEKGLQFLGSSRSDREDFQEAMSFLAQNDECKTYIRLLISQTVVLKNEEDISKWFEQDTMNDFKTLGVWQL